MDGWIERDTDSHMDQHMDGQTDSHTALKK